MDTMRRQHPGLHGMVDQLPIRWTAERREQWITAMIAVLDVSVTVSAPRQRVDDDEEESSTERPPGGEPWRA